MSLRKKESGKEEGELGRDAGKGCESKVLSWCVGVVK